MSIEAIGFDLDDTLYHRADVYLRVFEIMQSSLRQLDQSFETFYQVFQQFSDEEYELFIRRKKDKKSYQMDRIHRTYAHFGQTMTEHESVIFNNLYHTFRKDLRLRPGVETCLENLSRQNRNLFILTNGPGIDQRQKLRQLGIDQWIPENKWYISDEINHSKPDPKVYHFIEDSLSIKSRDILYIGDTLRNDVLGPNKVGWQSLYLNIHQTSVPEGVTACYNFSEIQREIYQFLNEQ